MLQITEGRQPRTEIVQRELATQPVERLDEAAGLGEIGDGGGFGDFKADARGVQAADAELLNDERQELVIAQTLPRKIDGAHGKPGTLIGSRHQPAERVFHHPAVDGRHQVVAFGGGDEMVRRHQLALLVAHADEQFEVAAAFFALQRHDGLAVQLEAAVLEGGIDPRGPLHLATTTHQVQVVFLEAVDAVAPRLLRGIAGTVGRR